MSGIQSVGSSSSQSHPNLASINDVSALFQTAKKYEELNVIGTGAYGTVYKARDLHNGGQIVAMKKVKVALTEDGIPLSTVREIALLRQLEAYQHPNIVRLLEVCHGGQSLEKDQQLVLFLVFEHVEQDLDSYLKRAPGPLSEQRIRSMSHDILSGVDFLHSHRIVHRDLKPHNLLVTSRGRVKLADFGLAKTYDTDMKLTSVVVTLWYRPPEVLLGTSYNTAVDVWSSGLVIIELHTRSALLMGTSHADQLHKVLRLIGRPPLHEWPENAAIVADSFPDYPPRHLEDVIPRIHPQCLDLVRKDSDTGPMPISDNGQGCCRPDLCYSLLRLLKMTMAHCNARPSSPPLSITEFPPQRSDLSHTSFSSRHGKVHREGSAFVSSLRHYPECRHRSLDRRNPWLPKKNTSSQSKSMRSLLQEKSQESHRCQNASKNIQTYTRTRTLNIRPVTVKRIVKKHPEIATKTSKSGPVSDQYHLTYDYLKRPSYERSRRPVRNTCVEVRHLTQMARNIRDKIQLICGDDAGGECPNMRQRLSQHQRRYHRQCVDQGVNNSAVDTGIQASCFIAPPCHFRPDSAPRSSICNTPGPSGTQDNCCCCHKPLPCSCTQTKLNKQNGEESIGFLSNGRPTEKQLVIEMTNWMKEIPVYPNESRDDRNTRENILQNLLEQLKDLIRIPDDKQYFDKAKERITAALNNIPMWKPESENDRKAFVGAMADNLLKKIGALEKPTENDESTELFKAKQVYDDPFEAEVANWLDQINLKSHDNSGKPVDKNKIVINLADKLRHIALNRPSNDFTYVAELKNGIREMLKNLPVENDSGNSINDLANLSADQLMSPNEDIIRQSTSTDEYLSPESEDEEAKSSKDMTSPTSPNRKDFENRDTSNIPSSEQSTSPYDEDSKKREYSKQTSLTKVELENRKSSNIPSSEQSMSPYMEDFNQRQYSQRTSPTKNELEIRKTSNIPSSQLSMSPYDEYSKNRDYSKRTSQNKSEPENLKTSKILSSEQKTSSEESRVVKSRDNSKKDKFDEEDLSNEQSTSDKSTKRSSSKKNSPNGNKFDSMQTEETKTSSKLGVIDDKIIEKIGEWLNEIPHLFNVHSGSPQSDKMVKDLAKTLQDINSKDLETEKVKNRIKDWLKSVAESLNQEADNAKRDKRADSLMVEIRKTSSTNIADETPGDAEIQEKIQQWLNSDPELAKYFPKESKDARKMLKDLAKRINELTSRGFSGDEIKKEIKEWLETAIRKLSGRKNKIAISKKNLNYLTDKLIEKIKKPSLNEFQKKSKKVDGNGQSDHDNNEVIDSLIYRLLRVGRRSYEKPISSNKSMICDGKYGRKINHTFPYFSNIERPIDNLVHKLNGIQGAQRERGVKFSPQKFNLLADDLLRRLQKSEQIMMEDIKKGLDLNLIANHKYKQSCEEKKFEASKSKGPKNTDYLTNELINKILGVAPTVNQRLFASNKDKVNVNGAKSDVPVIKKMLLQSMPKNKADQCIPKPEEINASSKNDRDKKTMSLKEKKMSSSTHYSELSNIIETPQIIDESVMKRDLPQNNLELSKLIPAQLSYSNQDFHYLAKPLQDTIDGNNKNNDSISSRYLDLLTDDLLNRITNKSSETRVQVYDTNKMNIKHKINVVKSAENIPMKSKDLFDVDSERDKLKICKTPVTEKNDIKINYNKNNKLTKLQPNVLFKNLPHDSLEIKPDKRDIDENPVTKKYTNEKDILGQATRKIIDDKFSPSNVYSSADKPLKKILDTSPVSKLIRYGSDIKAEKKEIPKKEATENTAKISATKESENVFNDKLIKQLKEPALKADDQINKTDIESSNSDKNKEKQVNKREEIAPSDLDSLVDNLFIIITEKVPFMIKEKPKWSEEFTLYIENIDEDNIRHEIKKLKRPATIKLGAKELVNLKNDDVKTYKEITQPKILKNNDSIGLDQETQDYLADKLLKKIKDTLPITELKKYGSDNKKEKIEMDKTEATENSARKSPTMKSKNVYNDRVIKQSKEPALKEDEQVRSNEDLDSSIAPNVLKISAKKSPQIIPHEFHSESSNQSKIRDIIDDVQPANEVSSDFSNKLPIELHTNKIDIESCKSDKNVHSDDDKTLRKIMQPKKRQDNDFIDSGQGANEYLDDQPLKNKIYENTTINNEIKKLKMPITTRINARESAPTKYDFDEYFDKDERTKANVTQPVVRQVADIIPKTKLKKRSSRMSPIDIDSLADNLFKEITGILAKPQLSKQILSKADKINNLKRDSLKEESWNTYNKGLRRKSSDGLVTKYFKSSPEAKTKYDNHNKNEKTKLSKVDKFDELDRDFLREISQDIYEGGINDENINNKSNKSKRSLTKRLDKKERASLQNENQEKDYFGQDSVLQQTNSLQTLMATDSFQSLDKDHITTLKPQKQKGLKGESSKDVTIKDSPFQNQRRKSNLQSIEKLADGLVKKIFKKNPRAINQFDSNEKKENANPSKIDKVDNLGKDSSRKEFVDKYYEDLKRTSTSLNIDKTPDSSFNNFSSHEAKSKYNSHYKKKKPKLSKIGKVDALDRDSSREKSQDSYNESITKISSPSNIERMSEGVQNFFDSKAKNHNRAKKEKEKFTKTDKVDLGKDSPREETRDILIEGVRKKTSSLSIEKLADSLANKLFKTSPQETNKLDSYKKKTEKQKLTEIDKINYINTSFPRKESQGIYNESKKSKSSSLIIDKLSDRHVGNGLNPQAANKINIGINQKEKNGDRDFVKIKSDALKTLKSYSQLKIKIKKGIADILENSSESLFDVEDDISEILADHVIRKPNEDEAKMQLSNLLENVVNLTQDEKEGLITNLINRVKKISPVSQKHEFSDGNVNTEHSDINNRVISFDKNYFRDNVAQEIFKFLLNLLQDSSENERQSLNHVSEEVANKITDIYSHPGLNPSEKEEMINDELLQCLQNLPLRPSISQDTLLQQLWNKILKYTAKTSSPSRSSACKYPDFPKDRYSSALSPIFSDSGSTFLSPADKRKSKEKQNKEENDYLSQLSAAINKWVHKLPFNFNKSNEDLFKNTMVNDLAANIVDKHKYFQLNNESKSNLNESELLKDQVFKCLNKILDDVMMSYVAPFIPQLIEQLIQIPVPVLVRPCYGNRKDMKRIGGDQPTELDAIEDNISIWLSDKSIENVLQLNKSARNKLINELAEKIMQLQQNNRAQEIEQEIMNWIANNMKKRDSATLETMVKSLKRWLDKIPIKILQQEDISRLKQDTHNFILENLEDGIMKWLTSTALYQKRTSLEKNLQKHLAKKLAKAVKNVLDAIGTTICTSKVDKELFKEILKHLKRFPMDYQERNNDNFLQNTAKQLLQYLKDLQLFQNLSVSQNENDEQEKDNFNETSKKGESIPKPNYVPESIYNAIKNWCNELPFADARNLDDEDLIGSLKQDIINKLVTKIIELNKKSELHLDDDVYFKLLQGEIDEGLNSMPKNQLVQSTLSPEDLAHLKKLRKRNAYSTAGDISGRGNDIQNAKKYVIPPSTLSPEDLAHLEKIRKRNAYSSAGDISGRRNDTQNAKKYVIPPSTLSPEDLAHLEKLRKRNAANRSDQGKNTHQFDNTINRFPNIVPNQKIKNTNPSNVLVPNSSLQKHELEQKRLRDKINRYVQSIPTSDKLSWQNTFNTDNSNLAKLLKNTDDNLKKTDQDLQKDIERLFRQLPLKTQNEAEIQRLGKELGKNILKLLKQEKSLQKISETPTGGAIQSEIATSNLHLQQQELEQESLKIKINEQVQRLLNLKESVPSARLQRKQTVLAKPLKIMDTEDNVEEILLEEIETYLKNLPLQTQEDIIKKLAKDLARRAQESFSRDVKKPSVVTKCYIPRREVSAKDQAYQMSKHNTSRPVEKFERDVPAHSIPNDIKNQSKIRHDKMLQCPEKQVKPYIGNKAKSSPLLSNTLRGQRTSVESQANLTPHVIVKEYHWHSPESTPSLSLNSKHRRHIVPNTSQSKTQQQSKIQNQLPDASMVVPNKRDSVRVNTGHKCPESCIFSKKIMSEVPSLSHDQTSHRTIDSARQQSEIPNQPRHLGAITDRYYKIPHEQNTSSASFNNRKRRPFYVPNKPFSSSYQPRHQIQTYPRKEPKYIRRSREPGFKYPKPTIDPFQAVSTPYFRQPPKSKIIPSQLRSHPESRICPGAPRLVCPERYRITRPESAVNLQKTQPEILLNDNCGCHSRRLRNEAEFHGPGFTRICPGYARLVCTNNSQETKPETLLNGNFGCDGCRRLRNEAEFHTPDFRVCERGAGIASYEKHKCQCMNKTLSKCRLKAPSWSCRRLNHQVFAKSFHRCPSYCRNGCPYPSYLYFRH